MLMVSHRFPPDAVAGVERYTESLAVELRAGGDDVTVLTRRPGAGPLRAEREMSETGIPVIRLTGGSVDRDRWLHLSERLDDLFRGVLAEVEPDAVHVNHLVDLSPGFLGLARDAGAAVILTLHDFWFPCPRITLQRPNGELCAGPEGGRACASHCFGGNDDRRRLPTDAERLHLRALYFRRLLDVPDQILCPSAYVAEWFEGWGLEPGRVRPVANGIRLPSETDEMPPRRSRREGLRLAILGAVVPHKGHHVVVDAISRAGIEADLFVHGPLGDSEYVARLRTAASTAPGLRMRLCGPYRPSDLSLLLEDVDVVLAPSIWPETFCLVIREALARGVPAITTELGALPAAIEDGVDGFLYRHDDPAQLAGLLERLVGEPGLLEQLKRGAMAATVPTLERHAAEIREIYREAASTRDDGEARANAAMAELSAIERLLEGDDLSDTRTSRWVGVA